MENYFSTGGIYNSGVDLIEIGNNLSNYLDDIESSCSKLKSEISMMKGYNGSFADVTYVSRLDNQVKHAMWVVNVSNNKSFDFDFDNIRKKVKMLKKDGDELEEVSEKLKNMIERVRKVLGDIGAADYFFGDLGKCCVIKENSSSLTMIHPELSDKKDKLIEMCEKDGIKIKITQTIRTVEEQDELYSLGRTKEGEIVTHARGLDYGSNHQWGVAFDVCIDEYKDESGDWVKCTSDLEKYDESKLKRVGKLGKSVGLDWGGDWKGDRTDTPHFQLKNCDKMNKRYKEPVQYVSTWFNSGKSYAKK